MARILPYLSDSCVFFPYISDSSTYTSSREQNKVLVSAPVPVVWDQRDSHNSLIAISFLMYQDSHTAFIRDDPSLLQYILRTAKKHKSHRTPLLMSDPSCGAVSMSMIDETQRFSSRTPGNTTLESNSPQEFVSWHQAHDQSNVATMPYTRHGIFLSPDDDMSPRPISELSSPLDIIHTQQYPTQSSNHATHPTATQVGALHPGGGRTTRPIRQSDIPIDFIHEQPQHSRPSNIAALPQARHAGSLIPQAVTTPGIPHSHGSPQHFTDMRHMMSLPSLFPKQWNQNDDDQSLETIDDLESVSQPVDPWKPPSLS